jgi:hypothetical protein
LVKFQKGINFNNLFAVDPTIKSDLAVVSHAHSDHLRAHKKIIATPETLAFARLQYKRFEAAPVEYNQKFKIGPATVELASAGHMLGSAQVIIDWYGERIVYTGDFKLDKNATCPQAEIHKCDTLLIDTTYGKPAYKFPSTDECKQRLLDFISEKFKEGCTPVVMAYSFGKAQEAMSILSAEGYEIEAHKKAYAATQIYKKFNKKIEGVYELNEKPEKGRVVLVPPGALKHIYTYGWGKVRTCFLSGWTLNGGMGHWRHNGYGIPFSDHASFDDIIKYIEIAKPEKIYTLFGPPDIAEYLNRIGFKAEAVTMSSGQIISDKPISNMDLFH